MRSDLRLWVLRAVAAVAVSLLALTSTCWLTLLRPGFAATTVNEVRGFDRLYSEVLPSAAAQAALKRHLDAVPLDTTYLVANLRLLLPPEVLAQVLTQLQRQYVEVLSGSRQQIDAVASLQPVVDHASRVLTELAPGLLAQAPRVDTASVNGFATAFARYRMQLRNGLPPLPLPNVALTPAVATTVAQALTSGLGTTARDSVRPSLEGLLRLGDLTGALATVLPYYLDTVLRETLADDLATAARSFSDSASEPLPQAPGGLPVALDVTVLLPSAAGLLVLALFLLSRSTQRWRPELTATLLASLAVAGLVGLVALALLPDPVRDAAHATAADSPQRALLLDLDATLRARLIETYLLLLAAAALIVAAVRLVKRRRDGSSQTPRAALAASIATAVLVTTAVVVVAHIDETPGTCNGQVQLCQRRYDQATYLTSHNAMASSSRSFVNANQDPDLTGQLDNGVRGLMLDLHPWTTPRQLRSYVTGLDEGAQRSLAPLLQPLRPRPGVWLCHVVCQLGADSAVDQLRRVGTWMRAHRDAVVTLILEDHVTEQEVRDAIEEAGLRPLVATPPRGSQPWPTLGAMVRSDHRLVVFTERAAPDDGWLRNLYTYAAETPFNAASSSELSCRPGRGPVLAPMFLLNNWISTSAPARPDAARVNQPGFLRGRVRACEQERSMRPTFIAVNFAQAGQPLEVVNELNALPPP